MVVRFHRSWYATCGGYKGWYPATDRVRRPSPATTTHAPPTCLRLLRPLAPYLRTYPLTEAARKHTHARTRVSPPAPGARAVGRFRRSHGAQRGNPAHESHPPPRDERVGAVGGAARDARAPVPGGPGARPVESLAAANLCALARCTNWRRQQAGWAGAAGRLAHPAAALPCGGTQACDLARHPLCSAPSYRPFQTNCRTF